MWYINWSWATNCLEERIWGECHFGSYLIRWKSLAAQHQMFHKKCVSFVIYPISRKHFQFRPYYQKVAKKIQKHNIFNKKQGVFFMDIFHISSDNLGFWQWGKWEFKKIVLTMLITALFVGFVSWSKSPKTWHKVTEITSEFSEYLPVLLVYPTIQTKPMSSRPLWLILKFYLNKVLSHRQQNRAGQLGFKAEHPASWKRGRRRICLSSPEWWGSSWVETCPRNTGSV